eukprot:2568510-Amphidinium_carterae.2
MGGQQLFNRDVAIAFAFCDCAWSGLLPFRRKRERALVAVKDSTCTDCSRHLHKLVSRATYLLQAKGQKEVPPAQAQVIYAGRSFATQPTTVLGRSKRYLFMVDLLDVALTSNTKSARSCPFVRTSPHPSLTTILHLPSRDVVT